MNLLFMQQFFFFYMCNGNRMIATWKVMFLVCFSCRNSLTLMTCSWEEKKYCQELKEYTILSCWQREPYIMELVNNLNIFRRVVNILKKTYFKPYKDSLESHLFYSSFNSRCSYTFLKLSKMINCLFGLFFHRFGED